MAAVGEDAEAALTGVGFLIHHLHADATHHVLAALHGKGQLHVLLMGLDARLQGESTSQSGTRPLETLTPQFMDHWKGHIPSLTRRGGQQAQRHYGASQ